MKTHCKRGHPFDDDNTRYDKRGYRYCRKCMTEAQHRYIEKKQGHQRASLTAKRWYGNQFTNHNPIARFWSFVTKGSSEDCWIWHGSTRHYFGKTGPYGQFAPEPKMNVPAHRYSYQLAFGLIPAGCHLHHICHNTLCVNPDHLKVLSPKTHILIGQTPPAINSRRTHCAQRHPFDIFNTTYRPDGRRRCRECIRLYNQRRRHRIKHSSTVATE